tara:strand:- start:375 stop:560 length:186 start_codon:yes stop_codon:yes gene_type:complete
MSWEDTIKKRSIQDLIDIQENLLSIVEKSGYFKDIPEGKQMALVLGREVLSYLREQQGKQD